MKIRRTGFTIIEMITVLAIIMILIGLLIPALNMVRHMARDTQERSQLAAISLGLEAWQQANSGSEYPASQYSPTTGTADAAVYTGAQRLAEALVGLDMRGYNPTHPVADSNGTDPYNQYTDATLSQRQSPYIDLTHGRVFKAVSTGRTGEGIFDGYSGTDTLTPDSLVICDVYKRFNVTYKDSNNNVVSTDKAGMPILYFAAHQVELPTAIEDYYHYADNATMMTVALNAAGKGALVGDLNQVRTQFDTFIRDPKSVSRPHPYPYRKDSYLLISAGRDGIYFTSDDITNFN